MSGIEQTEGEVESNLEQVESSTEQIEHEMEEVEQRIQKLEADLASVQQRDDAALEVAMQRSLAKEQAGKEPDCSTGTTRDAEDRISNRSD